MELYLGRHTTNYAVVCFYHLYVPLWHTMSHWAQPALHDTSLESQPSAERQEGVNPAQGSSAGQERAWGGKGFLLPVEHTVLFRPTPSRSLWEEWNVRKVVLGTGCCRETTDVSGHWGAKGWLPLLLSSDSPFYEGKSELHIVSFHNTQSWKKQQAWKKVEGVRLLENLCVCQQPGAKYVTSKLVRTNMFVCWNVFFSLGNMSGNNLPYIWVWSLCDHRTATEMTIYFLRRCVHHKNTHAFQKSYDRRALLDLSRHLSK